MWLCNWCVGVLAHMTDKQLGNRLNKQDVYIQSINAVYTLHIWYWYNEDVQTSYEKKEFKIYSTSWSHGSVKDWRLSACFTYKENINQINRWKKTVSNREMQGTDKLSVNGSCKFGFDCSMPWHAVWSPTLSMVVTCHTTWKKPLSFGQILGWMSYKIPLGWEEETLEQQILILSAT